MASSSARSVAQDAGVQASTIVSRSPSWTT
jgi:hypothetical protein